MTVLTELASPLNADTSEVMSWRRTYPAHADQADELRRFAACLLSGLPAIADVVTALTEMFDNALRHSDSRKPGGEVTVEIRRWPGCCVTAAVTDQGGPVEPRRQQATADEERQRGFAILDTVTTCWGWHGDVRGRTVTAIFLG